MNDINGKNGANVLWDTKTGELVFTLDPCNAELNRWLADQWKKSPTRQFKDPAIEDLWAKVLCGFGDDISQGQIAYRAGRGSVRFESSWVLAQRHLDSAAIDLMRAEWRQDQARKLLAACIDKGWSKLLQTVIDLGENLDLHAALVLAVKANRPACALFLCGLVGPDTAIEDGKTALIMAIKHGSAAAMEALLPVSDLSAPGLDLGAALALAVSTNSTSCALRLCELVDPNALIKDGKTALMLAVASSSRVGSSFTMIEALLPLSNLNIKSANGNTVLDIAKANGYDRGDCPPSLEDMLRMEDFVWHTPAAAAHKKMIVELLEAWSERAELQLVAARDHANPGVDTKLRSRSL